ncbi:hypothetical protein ACRALDRAFT_1065627 [Sodiomyces alcalophilus JCM 7366]|uniref:uncharacterized protein n=1 Tax=Sodiomyces alcalophilus JCM 7366 TaxID=591952 RepID=UPI0039B6DC90
MADKEATIFIIDVGAPMGDCHNGRVESDLDYSMRYVWDKLTTTVAASRKTWTTGIIGLRTDETRHLGVVQDDAGYENISVLQDIKSMSMSSLKHLQTVIKPSSTETGDALSAIAIALQMMSIFTKHLKYTRHIYLITDGTAPIDDTGVDDIVEKANEDGVQVTVLGVDFDDPEYGFKEEDKPLQKKQNEAILRDLVSKCNDGHFGTIAEAIDEMYNPRLKPVRPYKTYDGPLTLGDPNDPKHPSPMSIHVERYFKTKAAAPLSATTVVATAGQATQSQTLDGHEMGGANFAAVKQARTYKVEDPDAPGGKRDVEFESLAKGYEYGRTAVHISESEWNITKLETTKSFTILGFVAAYKYEPFLSMGESCMTVAIKYDERSQLALSSLIKALHQHESYAVARIVLKDGKEPLLVLLAPGIEPGFECLYDVPLPFAEDVRSYQFPPLDRVVTITGQTLTTHRLLPSDELSFAMSNYVDAMDLDTFDTDQNGQPAEYAPIDDSFNPVIHRINQAVRDRALHPDGKIGPIPPALVRYAAPPEDLIAKSKREIDGLIEAAEIKKVPPKSKSKRKRETVKPLSGLDVDALLNTQPKRPRLVTRDNAVPEFKQALASATDLDHVREACKQMGEVIRDLVTDSFGDSLYARAIEAMSVMRAELIELDEPDIYNTFVRGFKSRLLAGEFGGDRREMWWNVRTSRLGLIDQSQSELSKVTSEEAQEFLKAK